MTSNDTLKFSKGDSNQKLKVLRGLGYNLKTFSLPAGWTCPAALSCKAKVGRTGGLVDGPESLFRCFAASDEAQYPQTRDQRWHNFDALKGLDSGAMAALIGASLPKRTNLIRIHVSGDFFNRAYFLAWCEVARKHPSIRFYAYTKSLHLWIANRASVPSNLVLTASYGGAHDALIAQHGLKSSRVVFSVAQANGLPIDHDDTHAIDPDCQEFALLIHHTQPKGSEAGKAVRALKGLGSYSAQQTLNRERAMSVDRQAA